MRKENHLRRLISTLIQTLPAAFVANRALSIRKLNRFFFHIKVLHIHENEANPFKVVICEKIKILIQNHLVEDLMN